MHVVEDHIKEYPTPMMRGALPTLAETPQHGGCLFLGIPCKRPKTNPGSGPDWAPTGHTWRYFCQKVCQPRTSAPDRRAHLSTEGLPVDTVARRLGRPSIRSPVDRVRWSGSARGRSNIRRHSIRPQSLRLRSSPRARTLCRRLERTAAGSSTATQTHKHIHIHDDSLCNSTYKFWFGSVLLIHRWSI